MTYRSRRRSWKRKLTAFLAGIVVFSTTYGLVLPALTLDEDTAADEPGIVLEIPAEQNNSADESTVVRVSSWSGLSEDGALELVGLNADGEEADERIPAMREALDERTLHEAFELRLTAGEILDEEAGVRVTLYPCVVDNVNHMTLCQFGEDGTCKALPYEADAAERTVTFTVQNLGAFAFADPEPVEITEARGLSEDGELTLTWLDPETEENNERAAAMQEALEAFSLLDLYTLELTAGEILDKETGVTVTLRPYRTDEKTHLFLLTEDGSCEELPFGTDETEWTVTFTVRQTGVGHL